MLFSRIYNGKGRKYVFGVAVLLLCYILCICYFQDFLGERIKEIRLRSEGATFATKTESSVASDGGIGSIFDFEDGGPLSKYRGKSAYLLVNVASK
jgi:hypothetical protein